MHSTRGSSRDHRPDLHQVMRDLIVDHQAGIPLLRPPLSGHTSDAIDCRHVVTEHMAPLMEGDRDPILGSTYGDVAPRWRLIYSAHPRPQAQRTVAKQLLGPSAAEVKAFKPLSHTAFACEADAQQARATFPQGLQATRFHEGTIRPTRHSAMRGRAGKATVPTEQADHI
jgi:hypothetical protein